MKHKLLLPFALLVALFPASCTTKEDPVEDMGDAADEIIDETEDAIDDAADELEDIGGVE